MYKKISDYGLIGNMHSVALVSRDGSIDYCTMPHIDSPTVFAALLDDEKGGFFSIHPVEPFSSEQEYLADTNILKCVFRTKEKEAELFDFMPVTGQEMFNEENHIIHRCLRVVRGRMDFKLECFPRPGYAAKLPRIEREGSIFRVKSANKEKFSLVVRMSDYRVAGSNNGGVLIHFSLMQGESAHFDFIYGKNQTEESFSCGLDETKEFWLSWLHNCIAGKCTYLGEYSALVNRSLLVLKLLTFQPTGAIAAAATTSLPESIGGERNWDYRFTWLRDASFTLKALFNLGHIAEADSFISWLHGTYKRYGSRNLQIMYSLAGESSLTEKILGHLKGYRDSRPVRVGNAAYKQRQWDIYGEVMDTALRLSDYVGKIDENLWPFFKDICNLAAADWNKPDEGIWEVRNGPFHFVYSKVMCWVALDRGIKISGRYGFDAPLEKWRIERDKIKEEVIEKGYQSRLKSFVQRYTSEELDASLLLLPIMGFLPFDDERIKGTIESCKKYLLRDGFLIRYTASDGLGGGEGAFLLCNFWLVECLALSGRIEEAKEMLSLTLQARNHLGLFSEEYDFQRKESLGNFPQAFSHIGLINSVWAILNVQHKVSENKVSEGWVKRIEKLIPFKVLLNRTDSKSFETTQQIARQLKVSLNNLQGAFFEVREGRVNYRAMKESKSYRDYVELSKRLNSFDPFSLKSDREKKAFWINIYNIIIIHAVIELNIENSVKEIFDFFARIGYSIGGLFFSPDDIEHGILRGNSQRPGSRLRQFSMFDKRKPLGVEKFDPRIHFALVCAASSCPPIEFYTLRNIDSQLNTAARSFINRKGLVLEGNVLYLSQIFKWYFSDFGGKREEVINFALRFADDKIRNYASANIKSLKIKYLPYNWNLNKVLK